MTVMEETQGTPTYRNTKSSVLRQTGVKKPSDPSSSKSSAAASTQNGKTKGTPIRRKKNAPSLDIKNLPMSFYVFIVCCITFIICFLIFQLFSVKILLAVGSLITLYLVFSFGVRIFNIQAGKEVELDRNSAEFKLALEQDRTWRNDMVEDGKSHSLFGWTNLKH